MSSGAIRSSEAVYVHVPFCRRICGYCDFVRAGYSERLAAGWLDQIVKDIRAADCRAKTLYIGGGTPSALSCRELEALLGALDRFLPVAEYTAEAKPESLAAEKIRILRAHGVNRVSLGIQSFDPAVLQTLEREAGPQDAVRAIRQLREAGLENISGDLMYSLPGQTLGQWEADLRKAAQLGLPHLSIYSLTIEGHSRFAREGKRPLDDETEYQMYRLAQQLLARQGYRQYEVSNFAKSGRESAHNQCYWRYEDFTGIGLGAAGKRGHRRYTHTVNFAEYIRGIDHQTIVDLSDADLRFEVIMMGLRLSEGISRKDYRERLGADPVEYYPKAVAAAKRKGWLEYDDERLWAVGQGRYLLNDLIEEFLE